MESVNPESLQHAFTYLANLEPSSTERTTLTAAYLPLFADAFLGLATQEQTYFFAKAFLANHMHLFSPQFPRRMRELRSLVSAPRFMPLRPNCPWMQFYSGLLAMHVPATSFMLIKRDLSPLLGRYHVIASEVPAEVAGLYPPGTFSPARFMVTNPDHLPLKTQLEALPSGDSRFAVPPVEGFFDYFFTRTLYCSQGSDNLFLRATPNIEWIFHDSISLEKVSTEYVNSTAHLAAHSIDETSRALIYSDVMLVAHTSKPPAARALSLTLPNVDVACWADGGRWAATAAGASLRVWALGAGSAESAPAAGHVAPITGLDFTLDSLRLISVDSSGSWCVWDTQTVAPIRHGDLGMPLYTARWSALSGSEAGAWAAGGEAGIAVVGLERSVPTRFFFGGGSCRALAWHPAGHLLAGGFEDGTVRVFGLFDLETGTSTSADANGSFGGYPSPPTTPAHAPYFNLSAIAVFSGHGAPVTSLAWCPDGTCLASGDAEGVLMFHDAIVCVQNGKELLQAVRYPIQQSGAGGRGGASRGTTRSLSRFSQSNSSAGAEPTGPNDGLASERSCPAMLRLPLGAGPVSNIRFGYGAEVCVCSCNGMIFTWNVHEIRTSVNNHNQNEVNIARLSQFLHPQPSRNTHEPAVPGISVWPRLDSRPLTLRGILKSCWRADDVVACCIGLSNDVQIVQRG